MTHRYEAHVRWDGNRGTGTSTYTSYGREYTARIEGKPDLEGSSDPAFRGDPKRHNPEDLFVISLSACHMLFYLSLCAKHGIRVVSYDDRPVGTMVVDARGGGRFTEVVLRPDVRLAAGSDAKLADSLHDEAHALCFIANSCSVPVRHEAKIAEEAA